MARPRQGESVIVVALFLGRLNGVQKVPVEHLPLEIKQELVGSIAVLHVFGRLTIGEPSEQLHECLAGVKANGRKCIIVDLNAVPQIDSSGISALVRISIALNRNGGALRLVCKPGRCHDALTVTRLVEAIPTFDTEAAALRSFETLPLYFCFCPLCESRSDPPLEDRTAAWWQVQTCTHCDSRFYVTAEFSSQPQAVLQSLKIFPYGKGAQEEFVELTAGPPISLHVVGRLDLFTLGALRDALRTVPAPRKALIDLARITETTAAGRDALIAFVANCEAKDKFVICLEGLPSSRSAIFSVDSRFVQPSKKAALASLGPVTNTSPWLVRIERLV